VTSVIDIPTQIDAIQREVTRRTLESGEVVSALLRRRYDAKIEDVWDAVTDPQRVTRWFLPVSGDLHEGGDFQLEGNASGRILRCEPPRLLRATFGGETSIVELRLTADGEGTTLELEHTVPIEMAGSGAGALYVGPGWDGALMALGLYLGGQVADDPVAAANSPETQTFNRQSVHAWTAAIEKSGTAGPDDIAPAVEMSLAQFAPDVGEASDQNGNS
jgi:uncharacterized protein YndB with AHSA1/START domain